MLKCLLWDVDGTLADTERDGHRVAFNKAFDEAAIERHWDIPTYGKLLEVTGGKERIKTDFGDKLSTQEIAQLHARKTFFYQELIQHGHIPLRAGVQRLLEEAKDAGLILGVVTTTTPSALEALVVHTLGEAWLKTFAVMAAGDIVPAKKPAPDIYDYALNALGLNASDCLAIEDSYNGVMSATQAGIKTLITINDYTAKQDFSTAELVVSELGEPDRKAITIYHNPHQLKAHHISLQDCHALFQK
ncbi:MAG: HAD-IA family hydrolase [Mariprofundaceae bacterium]|nr:HAD-IA family hydrolase [Mariprofundaceae bacterium]